MVCSSVGRRALGMGMGMGLGLIGDGQTFFTSTSNGTLGRRMPHATTTIPMTTLRFDKLGLTLVDAI